MRFFVIGDINYSNKKLFEIANDWVLTIPIRVYALVLNEELYQ